MYIPYGCDNGSCPQYAGDPGNPDFRNWWISNAKRVLSHGYKGLWIDDANLVFRVSDGNGNFRAPHDPRTGQDMTEDAWRGYVAGFLQQIRSSIPDTELVHNSIWFAGGPDGPRALFRDRPGAANSGRLFGIQPRTNET